MAEAGDSASALSAQRQIPLPPATPAHLPTQASISGALQAWASGVRPKVLVVEAIAMFEAISIEAPGLRALMLEMFGGVVHDRELEPGEAL